MTILIILAVMLATWFGLYERMKGKTFAMDAQGKPWAFIFFHDRYSALLRYVGWITLIGLAVAVRSVNPTAEKLMLAALLDNVILQAAMLFWYEVYCHGGDYTARKYATVLTLAVGELIFFALGAALTVMMF